MGQHDPGIGRRLPKPGRPVGGTVEGGIHPHVRACMEDDPKAELARSPDDGDGFGLVHIAALVFGMQLDPTQAELPYPFQLFSPGRGAGMDTAERAQARQLIRRGRKIVDGMGGLGRSGDGEEQRDIHPALLCRGGQPRQGAVVMGMAFPVNCGKPAGVFGQNLKGACRDFIRKGVCVKIQDHGFIRFFQKRLKSAEIGLPGGGMVYIGRRSPLYIPHRAGLFRIPDNGQQQRLLGRFHQPDAQF